MSRITYIDRWSKRFERSFHSVFHFFVSSFISIFLSLFFSDDSYFLSSSKEFQFYLPKIFN